MSLKLYKGLLFDAFLTSSFACFLSALALPIMANNDDYMYFDTDSNYDVLGEGNNVPRGSENPPFVSSEAPNDAAKSKQQKKPRQENGTDKTTAAPSNASDVTTDKKGNQEDNDVLMSEAQEQFDQIWKDFQGQFAFLFEELVHYGQQARQAQRLWTQVQTIEHAEANRLDQIEPEVNSLSVLSFASSVPVKRA
jgi:hypothetical protein